VYKSVWSVLGLDLCCINKYITISKIQAELVQGGRREYSQIHNPINLSNILIFWRISSAMEGFGHAYV